MVSQSGSTTGTIHPRQCAGLFTRSPVAKCRCPLFPRILCAATMMWASSALLAAVSFLPGGALGFIVPNHVASLSGRTAVAPTPAVHVALGDRPHCCRRGGASLSMQSSAADQADKTGGDSAAGTADGVPWAEKRFPNCSTVLSKVCV